LIILLSGCATMRDSLVLGAATGFFVGGIAGNQSPGDDQSENMLKGAVIGSIIGSVASYAIHGSLETRDSRVRKETLLNLEKYDVMGRDGVAPIDNSGTIKSDKCYTTREVDGRLMSIPCRYVDDPNDLGLSK
jgi:hypothetical protein